MAPAKTAPCGSTCTRCCSPCPSPLDPFRSTTQKSFMAKPAKREFPNLPTSLAVKRQGDIAILSLARPHKRNALDDTTVIGIERFFAALPKGIKAVVMHGRGEHFSAGLDLSELTERSVAEGVEHSRMWHRVFARIEFGKVPV